MGGWGKPNAYIVGGWLGIARCLYNQKNKKNAEKQIFRKKNHINIVISNQVHKNLKKEDGTNVEIYLFTNLYHCRKKWGWFKIVKYLNM